MFSDFVGLDIDFSGFVDGVFSVLEVLELFNEVGNLSGQTGDFIIEGANSFVNDD